jgi:hypothetical protein
VGSESGRDVDKFARHRLTWAPGPVLGLPLVAGCVAWLELRHIPEPHAETAYDTVFGEVVSAKPTHVSSPTGAGPSATTTPNCTPCTTWAAGVFAVPSRVVRAGSPDAVG